MDKLTSEGQLEKLTSEVEEECLKASGHLAPGDAVYETPSDFNPLAINMGQLIIYRSVQTLRIANNNGIFQVPTAMQVSKGVTR